MNNHTARKNSSSVIHLMMPSILLMVFLFTGCASSPKSLIKRESMNIETQTLKNGLTVYLVENSQVPLVTVDMWVKVGSKDEPSEIAGISHFLEHMLFKGTPRLGVGEYDRRIEELGGYLNAATSGDYTHYYLTVPSANVEAALTDMADVLFNSSLDPQEFEQERQVILEEISMKLDQPVGFLYDEIVRLVYESGPYENTVIGSEETVSEMTRDQLKDHYERYYAPENMALVVVGDFDSNQMMAAIQREFNNEDRPYNPYKGEKRGTVFARQQDQVWQKEWQQTYFFFTFPGHALTDLERVAVDSVLEQILSGGRSSKLVRTLREEKGLVSSISIFGPSYKLPGFWGIYGTCDVENLNEVKEEVTKIFQEMRDGDVSDDELRRAKKTLITDHLYELETNAGKASVIGQSYALLDSPDLYSDYTDAVDRVTKRDVKDTLDALLENEMSTFVARPRDLIPELNQPSP